MAAIIEIQTGDVIGHIHVCESGRPDVKRACSRYAVKVDAIESIDVSGCWIHISTPTRVVSVRERQERNYSTVPGRREAFEAEYEAWVKLWGDDGR